MKMGGFFKDVLKGAAKQANANAEDENKLDLIKAQYLAETPEIMKREENKQQLEVWKENEIRKSKLAAADEIAKQFDATDPEFAATIRLSPVAYGAATARASGDAKGKIPMQVNDLEDRDENGRPKQKYITRDEFVVSGAGGSGRYVPMTAKGVGAPINISDNETKDLTTIAKANQSVNLLSMAIKPKKTPDEQKILAANGLGDLSKVTKTNPATGRIAVDLATLGDKAAAQLYQKIEEISSGARYSLYAGNLTETEVQNWNKQGLNTKDTIENIFAKLPAIIKGSNIDVKARRNWLIQGKGATDEQTDSFLLQKQGKPDLYAGVEEMDKYYQQAQQEDNPFMQVPTTQAPSPSADASVEYLTAPNTMAPDQTQSAVPNQAIEPTSAMDANLPSELPSTPAEPTGPDINVIRARLMAAKKKYGNSPQYTDEFNKYKASFPTGQ